MAVIGGKKLKRKRCWSGCGIEMRKRNNWGQDAKMWKRPKITAPILGEFCEVVPRPLRSCEKGTIKQARARTTIENKKDNIKVCVCSLSLSLFSRRFIFLCLSKVVDSFYILSFSLFDDNRELAWKYDEVFVVVFRDNV